jgi:hypothetical protein
MEMKVKAVNDASTRREMRGLELTVIPPIDEGPDVVIVVVVIRIRVVLNLVQATGTLLHRREAHRQV